MSDLRTALHSAAPVPSTVPSIGEIESRVRARRRRKTVARGTALVALVLLVLVSILAVRPQSTGVRTTSTTTAPDASTSRIQRVTEQGITLDLATTTHSDMVDAYQRMLDTPVAPGEVRDGPPHPACVYPDESWTLTAAGPDGQPIDQPGEPAGNGHTEWVGPSWPTSDTPVKDAGGIGIRLDDHTTFLAEAVRVYDPSVRSIDLVVEHVLRDSAPVEGHWAAVGWLDDADPTVVPVPALLVELIARDAGGVEITRVTLPLPQHAAGC